ncbi:STN domain-containing protein [Xanthomonas sp. NCPPB 2654]|uniref:STN domain-containing protein n=1 Tax=unclassified Xanthomonas TaxID=2643310 RepID=UPI0021E0D27F|nr:MULTISPECIES: STN domain-containing protein [unclassified Xanthomonas]MDL5367456.1 STN domain-containing protein [Xanthomonas sp. NCPPB 2654]UYC21677.1 STN domain-containing protein [Xanthomonas sp. CFBP 8443]
MPAAFRASCSGLALIVLLTGCDMAPSSAPSHPAAAAPAPAATPGKCDAMPDHAYDLPAARFDETAQQLAHATGCGIVYDDPSLSPLQVNAVKGRVSIRRAIHQAIDGTALQITQESADTIAVARR